MWSHWRWKCKCNTQDNKQIFSAGMFASPHQPNTQTVTSASEHFPVRRSSATLRTISQCIHNFELNGCYIQGIHKRMVQFQVNKKFISQLSRAQRTPSAAATVPVSHALPAVRFSCLMRGRGASFKDGVAAGEGFLCPPFWGVQICDYSAAWVPCTV
jgi:hypothetical protein